MDPRFPGQGLKRGEHLCFPFAGSGLSASLKRQRPPAGRIGRPLRRGLSHSLRPRVGIQVYRRKCGGQGVGDKLRHLRPFHRNARRQCFPRSLPRGGPHRILHKDRAYHPGFRGPVRQGTLRGVGGNSAGPARCPRHLVCLLLDLPEARRGFRVCRHALHGRFHLRSLGRHCGLRSHRRRQEEALIRNISRTHSGRSNDADHALGSKSISRFPR